MLLIYVFMKPRCPKCTIFHNSILKFGHYFRSSDSKRIQRYQCKHCHLHFSSATPLSCYKQKKRRLNKLIQNALCSNMSQRRIALLYNISRVTVARKLKFLAQQAEKRHKQWQKQNTFDLIQLDDLETFEHTKCKPLTVTVLVNEKRKIIDFGVASIGAKGHLARISRKKYGPRENRASEMRNKLFSRIKKRVCRQALIQSDDDPHYRRLLKRFFPHCTYETFKSIPSCVTGQGELKKTGFDRLFRINHTLAMLRANINRLIRKTWCTTKKVDSLRDHIMVYVDFHNRVLTV